MTDFDRDARVRIDLPDTELHNRAATVLHETKVLANGTYRLAYMVVLDRPASNGSTALIVPADQLVPDGSALR